MLFVRLQSVPWEVCPKVRHLLVFRGRPFWLAHAHAPWMMGFQFPEQLRLHPSERSPKSKAKLTGIPMALTMNTWQVRLVTEGGLF